VPRPGTGTGTAKLNVNLLDYTLGKAAPTTDALVESLAVQMRSQLAALGVPENAIDLPVQSMLGLIKASADFAQLVGLAQQLAGLNSNPWLRHVNTDAQGYTVVTLTAGSLVAQFKQVNRLVGSSAPANVIAKVTTATVKAGEVAVAIS
jgi:alkaline phosphatase D